MQLRWKDLYDEQLDANVFENLSETGNFRKECNLPKLIQEEIAKPN